MRTAAEGVADGGACVFLLTRSEGEGSSWGSVQMKLRCIVESAQKVEWVTFN